MIRIFGSLWNIWINKYSKSSSISRTSSISSGTRPCWMCHTSTVGSMLWNGCLCTRQNRKMHANPHMSTASEGFPSSFNYSGAMYPTLPHPTKGGLDSSSWVSFCWLYSILEVSPKSEIFTWRSLVIKIFSGFKSLWIICSLWITSIPSAIW